MQELHQNRSVAITQKRFRRVLLKALPRREDILRWQEKFLDEGNLGHRGGNIRHRILNQRVKKVRLLFQNDPSIGICRASTAPKMP